MCVAGFLGVYAGFPRSRFLAEYRWWWRRRWSQVRVLALPLSRNARNLAANSFAGGPGRLPPPASAEPEPRPPPPLRAQPRATKNNELQSAEGMEGGREGAGVKGSAPRPQLLSSRPRAAAGPDGEPTPSERGILYRAAFQARKGGGGGGRTGQFGGGGGGGWSIFGWLLIERRLACS